MKPDYFDIHSHVHFTAFDEGREDVMKRSLESKTWMINVGTQKDTSRNAVELAEKYERGVFATVGLHPIHTDKSFHDKKEIGVGGDAFVSRGEEFDYEYYKNLALHEKVVAIGECGLDYYRAKNEEFPSKADQPKTEGIKKQVDVFEQQISLALELDLPLMIHCRPTPGTIDAYKDVLEILNSYFLIHNSKLRGNVHFFAGNWEEAKEFLDIGFTLSFTGVITFARDYDEVIRNTPIDMLMAETDCPYVAPASHRGKRNEPMYVKETVTKIAEIKGIDLEEVRKMMVENAFRVFNLTT